MGDGSLKKERLNDNWGVVWGLPHSIQAVYEIRERITIWIVAKL